MYCLRMPLLNKFAKLNKRRLYTSTMKAMYTRRLDNIDDEEKQSLESNIQNIRLSKDTPRKMATTRDR